MPSVPRQTILQLNQDLQLDVKSSQVNMCNPNRHLMIIYDININDLTDILLFHSQHLSSEERVDDATTSTASTPIVISTYPR